MACQAFSRLTYSAIWYTVWPPPGASGSPGMTIADGAGESDATIVLAGVPACRILTSSFGRAVLATRPDSAGPEAGPVITVSSAEAGTFCLIVTEDPVAGPPGEPPADRPQPASRVAAAAATPIRPARWMSFLIVSSFSSSRRPPPRDLRCLDRKSAARAAPDSHFSVSRRESGPLLWQNGSPEREQDHAARSPADAGPDHR